MAKYKTLLGYELKTVLKDPMNLFMILYPPMMLLICAYLLPWIITTTAPDNEATMATSLLIAFAVILAIGSYLMGAMLGFVLLENKDENTLVNIAVSPITVSGYALFKVSYTFVFAVLGNLVMVGGLKLLASDVYTITYGSQTVALLDAINWWQIIVFSIVNSLFCVAIAFFMASISKNKIEGFAIVKGGGIIVFIPILALLPVFQDWKQYLLGIVPIFWPLKAILNEALMLDHPANLGFYGYMLIGTLLCVALGAITLKQFLNKVGLK